MDFTCMISRLVGLLLLGLLWISNQSFAAPKKAADLRLVPFPKEVKLKGTGFCLTGQLTLTVSDSLIASYAAKEFAVELGQVTGAVCEIAVLPVPTEGDQWVFSLSSGDHEPGALKSLPTEREGYGLEVQSDSITVAALGEPGLACGIGTLRQLVRANLDGQTLPGVTIRDWPSLRYRIFQDDITRGQSPKLSTLKREVDLGALLKLNGFTYYMEHQYAFAKHPEIGPKDGSLLPAELKALNDYCRQYNVELIGCQQSFGHLTGILQLEAYKDLRETLFTICPTNEATYKLLDDLYSEEAPLLDSKLFNVCCDETFDLGTGPSKALADEIGVGGVYVRHIRRIHDLLRDKYGKRMMMWGDIILQHPEELDQIPQDTVMLSWGYDPRTSFEEAIKPFADSGYEFIVCPGVSCWNRVLPDFDVAVTNIHNYVRDGVKLGALGMLNTVWSDDSENLYPWNWHAIAWSAECAWNGSATSIEDFNRRVGAVLYGEEGDDFGQAIKLLGKTHRLPGYSGMMNREFLQGYYGQSASTEIDARRQAEALLALTGPALEHLGKAREEARFNAEDLEVLIFGADRMQLIATRQLGFLDAARAYERAQDALPNLAQAEVELATASALLQQLRDAHADLKARYRAIFLAANKPYVLDGIERRYDALLERYDALLAGLADARTSLTKRGELPSAKALGLRLVETGARATRPAQVVETALTPDIEWALPDQPYRLGLTVAAGDVARVDLPIEVDLPSRKGLSGAIQLMELEQTGEQTLVLCQVDSVKAGKRLAFLLPGPTEAGKTRRLLLYYGGAKPSKPATGVSLAKTENSMLWLENADLRLLLGEEGAHIYRWEVKALDDLDLTEPGETNWAGFADLSPGTARNAANKLEVTSRGPALVRVRCTDPDGLVKTISLWAGVAWAEVTLNTPTSWFWCYDDISLMGAESNMPGSYLFPGGVTGPLRPSAGVESQEPRSDALWGAKFVPEGVLLALLTPSARVRHIVGPGGGMGGVGIDGSPAAAYFVIYGGPCPSGPAATLEALTASLDFTRQAEVTVFGSEKTAKRSGPASSD